MTQKISNSELEHLKKLLKVKDAPCKYEKNLWNIVKDQQKFFEKIPGILSICVCNSLSMNAAHKNSDIDLFVITQKNRLWTARFFLTIYCQIRWIRKTNRNHAGKFCLSFFIDNTAYDFSNIALPKDPYLTLWLRTLHPIINRHHSFEQFINANSSLISNSENPYYNADFQKYKLKKESFLLTKCFDISEMILKTLFIEKTKKSFQKLWKPYWIIINDHMLKFHNNDKRIDFSKL